MAVRAQVLVQAGGSADEVDEGAVNATAACLADFLRLFAEVGIGQTVTVPVKIDAAALETAFHAA